VATRAVLVAAVHTLALPFVLSSRAMESFGLGGLRNDLERCLVAVDAAPELPYRFVATLIAAEDHRSSTHPGIDPISILRVVLLWLRTGKVQGASTIEQQLVRVVLGRYERTWRRKATEQMVAIALSRKRSKAKIASTYLSMAFYGSGKYGVVALTRACGPDLNAARQGSVSHMVARLKYPEPLYTSLEWRRKIFRRIQYIANRLPDSASPIGSTRDADGDLNPIAPTDGS
jgi:monofunctional glycosyltransferase